MTSTLDIAINGFIYLFSNTILGSALLFMLLFVFILAIFLLISKCSLEQIMIFILIPLYSAKDTLLTGFLGMSFLIIVGFIDAYILFKNITSFTR